MRKTLILLSLIAPFIIAACSNEKAETKKEIIVVPVPPATVTPAPEKNTTIVVDKNGVKVATKKIDVSINPQKKKQ